MDDMRDKIMDWLERFGIKRDVMITFSEEEIAKAPEDLQDFYRQQVVVPYRVTDATGNDLKLESRLVVAGDWLKVKVLLLEDAEIPERLRLRLYEELLLANFDLNEVTFSLSPEGDVFVEADMPLDSTYENFESEYGAVEYGIDYFLKEICMSLQECMDIVLKNTYNPKGSSLYI